MIKHRSRQETVQEENKAVNAPETATIEPEIQGSKSVKVEADKIADEEVMIDYMKQSFSADDAKKKTKEHTEPKSAIPGDKPIGEIREEIAKSEASRSGDKFTFKDIHQIATFLINAFDGGISIMLNFLGRDNRVSVYTLPAETKRQLADQLSLIFVKYQVKFKIEFLFFITLLLAYMGPVGLVLKRRKDKSGKEPEPKRETPKREYIKKEPEVNNELHDEPPTPVAVKKEIVDLEMDFNPEEAIKPNQDTVIRSAPRTKNKGRKKAHNYLSE